MYTYIKNNNKKHTLNVMHANVDRRSIDVLLASYRRLRYIGTELTLYRC